MADEDGLLGLEGHEAFLALFSVSVEARSVKTCVVLEVIAKDIHIGRETSFAYLLRLYRIIGRLDDHVLLPVHLQTLGDDLLRIAGVIERIGNYFEFRGRNLDRPSALLRIVGLLQSFSVCYIFE